MATSLRDYLWLNKKRFTQEEFARRLGIAETYLSKIANGYKVPSITLAKKIELESNGEVRWHELMEFCHKLVQEKNSESK